MGVKVKPRHKESLDRMLKRLKRTLEKEGLRRDLARHRYHETENVRRRRERLKNAKKARSRRG
jgi:ribosomal protein S21